MTIRIGFAHAGNGKLGLALRLAPCVGLLWCLAGTAHAAPIYKCVGTHGPVTFRDTPCAGHARQTKLDLRGQPLIDPDAPRHATAPHTPRHATRPHHRRTTASSRRHRPSTSWECRAADGEIFYRHTRCPGSVPGDGMVRVRWGDDRSERTPRRRRNAWSAVRVHGVRIPRSEACRRIHSAGASGRDGHRRDATVSTYDHLMGRDPCSET